MECGDLTSVSMVATHWQWSPPVTTLEAEAGPGLEMGQTMDQVPLCSCIKLVADWKIINTMNTVILYIHVDIIYYLRNNVVHN